ncbi:MAG: fatty acyl-AMP ligase [Bacteroidia bacterium]|nr:fatty acyl-AMP ligase [Bacteroidia bacterium]
MQQPQPTAMGIDLHTEQTLVEMLMNRSALMGDKLALAFFSNGETLDQSLSYRQLDQRARAIAVSLMDRGLHGRRVLLLYPSGLEYLAAFFGCLYAGVVAVPVYPPQMGKQMLRIQAIIQDSQSELFLTDRRIYDNLVQNLPEFMAATAGKWMFTEDTDPGQAGLWQMPGLSGDSLAFLQYTSGSTGLPKGVMVSHGNLLNNERIVRVAYSHDEHSDFAGWLPLYHDMGLIGNVLQPLFLGSTSYLFSPMSFIQKPVRWLQLISRYRAHTSGAPNFAYDLCVQKVSEAEKATLDLSSWKVAYNGAEPVRAHTLRNFAAAFASCGFQPQQLFPCYGMAEATLFVAGGPKGRDLVITPVNREALQQDQIVFEPEGSPDAQELVGCGPVWGDHRVRIVNPETFEALPDAVVGEIWLQGPSVCQGYWNRPELSDETFRARLAGEDEGPFLRTGDLGFLRAGELYITGRLKDLIIIRGRNHYPQDIELTVAQSHPVLHAGSGAAFPLDVDGEERLVVIQEIDPGLFRTADPEEIFMAVRKAVTLGHELQLHEIVLVKRRTVPKTSSGKIQRRASKQQYLDGELQTEASWKAQPA